ncbi:MAG TPA: glutathione S-transferase family protein [Candidatus Binatia bacterium]|nr:glutathione S-transferase family protein [Candidatus Binatia bacterium]
MKLYGHPFSSYTQKVLIALYENATPFDYVHLGEAAADGEHRRLWPVKKMPTLEDRGRVVLEATVIVEYLDLRYPGPARMIPADADAALEVRMLDRIFDHYVMAPMQKIVGDHLRPAGARDPHGVQEAHALLDTAYRWLDGRLAGREWAAGREFTLADCAAAPSLFYADWVHPVPETLPALRACRARLLQRPSFARCVDEARPYRDFFPPGAPARD